MAQTASRQVRPRGQASKPRLLLLLARADHPHRDPVCATVSWLAAERDRHFECYFAPSGAFSAGHHLEQFYRLLVEFEVEIACLGPSPFDVVLTQAGVRILASADIVSEFYWQLLINLDADRADGLLLVGDGGRPQGVALTAYAYPEIVNRRLLAISAEDQPALDSLRGDLALEGLWLTGPPPKGAVAIEAPAAATAAEQTAWMARRWQGWARGHLLGGPELAARWVPYAVSNQLPALFGIPQRQVIQLMRDPLSQQAVVIGQALEGHDLHELSRTGASLQVVGAGRPPFPVLSRAARQPALPPSHPDGDPDDGQLERWATEGRVLATLLLWTGAVGELESLYLLADLLAVTRLACGLVLTTSSFDFMP
ncbi:MAG: hypothetical protein J2P45_16555, partial [Candidatus Dormibacteraeota bacterium]|nr:hypothetical protein [Candidatus Dormibacteraeota bacterium]